MPSQPTPQAFLPTPTPFTGLPLRPTPQPTHSPPRHHPPTCKIEEPAPRRLRPKKKASAFENTIDDLTMKRMGRGTIYYGKRISPTSLPETDQLPNDDLLLKPDPVLVTGGTGRTGQWVALGLVNQGFNVRVLTRSFETAETMFGPSGSNLDVIPGNLGNVDEVVAAVDGAVSVVVASGAPWWWPGGYDAVDVRGVANLLAACKQTGSVKRFVLISDADGGSARGKAKRAAERLVRESGVPYVIVRAARLRDDEGGLRRIEILPGEEVGAGGELSRVDLAQCVCQALVYDRKIGELREEDPDGEFDFPSCVVTVRNGSEPYTPEKRFWGRAFNRVSDAYRDKTGVEDGV